jgi:hypothetical protein
MIGYSAPGINVDNFVVVFQHQRAVAKKMNNYLAVVRCKGVYLMGK